MPGPEAACPCFVLTGVSAIQPASCSLCFGSCLSQQCVAYFWLLVFHHLTDSFSQKADSRKRKKKRQRPVPSRLSSFLLGRFPFRLKATGTEAGEGLGGTSSALECNKNCNWPHPPTPLFPHQPFMEKSATQGSVPLTTFVQADTSTFRELVQKLTGATDEELRASPSTYSDAIEGAQQTTTIPKPMGVKRPTFKLNERRQYSRPKLEIVKPTLHFKPGQLIQSPSQATFLEPGLSPSTVAGFSTSPAVLSPSTPGFIPSPLQSPSTSFSNLSILDRECKDSACLNSEEEERAIKERRFYLHPSPRSRPGDTKPELLPLFPLSSPTNHES